MTRIRVNIELLRNMRAPVRGRWHQYRKTDILHIGGEKARGKQGLSIEGVWRRGRSDGLELYYPGEFFGLEARPAYQGAVYVGLGHKFVYVV